MIRVNLLPQKRAEPSADGGQLWLLVVLFLFLAEVVALFVFHGLKKEELDEQLRKNAELQEQIDQSRQAVSNHAEVQEKLKTLRAKEDAISGLQNARTGPTAMLLEVARILTPGRGPSVDPDVMRQRRIDDPSSVPNLGWDARRLWLLSFVEAGRLVRLDGLARDGEDVSELARRMNISAYFYDVKLLPAKKEMDPESKLELVKFQLEAKVRY